MVLCNIQYESSSPFLSASFGYVLSMFLNFGHFSASCSYKKVLIKKSVLELNIQIQKDKQFTKEIKYPKGAKSEQDTKPHACAALHFKK